MIFPKVAVIILTYGNYCGLEKTLDSVIRQTYPIASVMVSDDGSGKPFPPEITVHFPNVIFRANKWNLGTVAHMNAAANALIDHHYFKFLGVGDSFSDSGALSALVDFAQKMHTPVVTSQVFVCNQTLQHKFYRFPGRRRGQAFRRSAATLYQTLAVNNLVSAVGTLFSQSFFMKFGGFDEEYRLLEDWPTWLRLTRNGHSIPLTDRVTCLYGAGGISSENTDAYHSDALKNDMLLCYKKEILLYLDRFDQASVRRIQYGFDRLQGLSPDDLLSRYGWLERITRWKREIKLCLFCVKKK